MQNAATQLVAWYRECVPLCADLSAALRAEREALIAFNINGLSEATLRKDQAMRAVQTRRTRMREVMLKQFGATESAALVDKFPVELQAEWLEADLAWQRAWTEVYSLCEQNQRFLKHSLRNLGLMLDHFKRLIGEKPTYSAKGTRVDKPFEGKVIEGRY